MPAKRPTRERATYRVRVDLTDAEPPIWRRLELRSDLGLDDLHRIIQAAFGWTDTHLHRFAIGSSVWAPDAQLFLCPFDVEEGDDEGVPEGEVHLDDVLVDVGDRLLYVYDYGDGWEHILAWNRSSNVERMPLTPFASMGVALVRRRTAEGSGDTRSSWRRGRPSRTRWGWRRSTLLCAVS